MILFQLLGLDLPFGYQLFCFPQYSFSVTSLSDENLPVGVWVFYFVVAGFLFRFPVLKWFLVQSNECSHEASLAVGC